MNMTPSIVTCTYGETQAHSSQTPNGTGSKGTIRQAQSMLSLGI